MNLENALAGTRQIMKAKFGIEKWGTGDERIRRKIGATKRVPYCFVV